MEIKHLTRDPNIVEDGQWIDNIPNFGDARLKVRGLSSKIVLAARAKKERGVPLDGRQADGQLTPEATELIFSDVLHEAVLLDWKNFTDANKALLYSADTAKQWCTDPNFRPFADAVTWAAQVVDRGWQDTKVGLEKNSSSSLPGKSSGEPQPKT